MPILTHSPESAYSSKDNIKVPLTEPRTAAAIRAVALQEAQDTLAATISAVTLPVKEV